MCGTETIRLPLKRIHAASARSQSRMAVAEGFEPSDGGYPSHAFEACSLGRSDTPPRVSLPADRPLPHAASGSRDGRNTTHRIAQYMYTASQQPATNRAMRYSTPAIVNIVDTARMNAR
jgi:hypothetical protein